jgi:hypothetical protein
MRICRDCNTTAAEKMGTMVSLCRPCLNGRASARRRASTQDDKAYVRFTQKLRRYRLTLDQYHALAESQSFQCAVCDREPTPIKKVGSGDGFVIDHCHSTGKVRGLLCHSCNVAIGHLQESAEVVMSAARYLGRAA